MIRKEVCRLGSLVVVETSLLRRSSDAHLVPAGDSDWVVLPDAPREGHLRLESQRVYHEKTPALETGSLEERASVPAARGMLVLERRPPCRFRPVSAISDWASSWVCERGAVDLAARRVRAAASAARRLMRPPEQDC